jgi:hypothetical protein
VSGRAAAAVCLVLLAGCASEQPAPPHGGAGGPEHAFAHASLFISPAGQPFRAAPGEPYPVARWFAQADRNGDGRLDRTEFRADAEAFFRTLDANHDGVLEGLEVAAYEHDVVPEILGAYRAPSGAQASGPRGGDGGGGRRRGRGGGGRGDGAGEGAEVFGGATAYELLPIPEPVASADRTLSGRVTLADFLRAMDERYDLLDPTGRGYLTLSDLPRTPVQQAEDKAKRSTPKPAP